jgi:hypothetical protein
MTGHARKPTRRASQQDRRLRPGTIVASLGHSSLVYPPLFPHLIRLVFCSGGPAYSEIAPKQ